MIWCCMLGAGVGGWYSIPIQEPLLLITLWASENMPKTWATWPASSSDTLSGALNSPGVEKRSWAAFALCSLSCCSWARCIAALRFSSWSNVVRFLFCGAGIVPACLLLLLELELLLPDAGGGIIMPDEPEDTDGVANIADDEVADVWTLCWSVEFE